MKKLAFRAWTSWQNLKHRDEGQGMVEYALLIALIAVVVAAFIPGVTGAIGSVFSSVANTINP
ncbi:Flp family type IVb pilin [Alicyclobacillaceae bacterium I2511]|jgi:Flp pilus assembly pilin Flp|nr:Flp family type IVb pilin [Alicyclobacillaceae bacterium I2511]